MKKKLSYLIIIILVLIPLYAFGDNQKITLTGKTMGTTYNITIIADSEQHTENIHEKIDRKLDDVNQSMSVYSPDSEINRFNAFKETDSKFRVSDNFMEVLRVSKTVYHLTGGAWDGTVSPLVKLWGFMAEKLPTNKPEKKEIEKKLPHIGFDKIVISGNNHIQKKDPEITLDLGSIAKGHGVDQVSQLLLNEGFENFLVEIGGDLYGAGTNLEKNPWRVGINTPDKNAPFDEVYKVITLTGLAMATSGDYRSLIEIDGRHYSHIIDPKTGYPVQNQVASVTVIAQTCTFADGLATAFMVMDPEKSLDLINRLTNVEGLIITRNPDGTYTEHYSEALIP